MKVNQRQDCPQNIPLFYPVYQPFQFPCHANFNSQINDPCKRSHYCEKPGFGISSEGNSKGSLKFKMSNKFKIKNIIPSLTSLVNLRNVQRQEVKHHRFQPQHHVQRHKRVPKNKHIKSRAILQYQK